MNYQLSKPTGEQFKTLSELLDYVHNQGMVLDVSNMDPHTLTNINIIDPPTESENEDKLGDDELDIVSDNLEQYANALTILEKEKRKQKLL